MNIPGNTRGGRGMERERLPALLSGGLKQVLCPGEASVTLRSLADFGKERNPKAPWERTAVPRGACIQ